MKRDDDGRADDDGRKLKNRVVQSQRGGRLLQDQLQCFTAQGRGHFKKQPGANEAINSGISGASHGGLSQDRLRQEVN